ncbi:Winged helix-turn-helix DNA-binding [Geoglobus ahangari]|uniref:Winged helix-turn-helix DNA-binding n=1 Tax=Geoglobus ahangari TaxID=113653 RepID=A0A0F7IFF2_9EURY|nr:winged helix-turn-helix transcriptional regulator [Geoglobus ahangari]AKG91137.1 Winged helix-turn-helix DNA-binding [Geoglobus ahangari]NOY12058.1 winged helix-turn-helix transcriptional regulator [Archaeoglobi archaeon]
MSEEKIIEVLKNAGKPLKTKEIAELAGMDSKEVSKIISKLKKEGKITSPKRCYYSV